MGCNRLACSQSVVARQAAAGAVGKRSAGDGDQVGRRYVLAIEGGAAGGGYNFTANQASGNSQRRRGGEGAVIDLVRSGDGHRQRCLGDGGYPCAAGEGIIAGQAVGAVPQQESAQSDIVGSNIFTVNCADTCER